MASPVPPVTGKYDSQTASVAPADRVSLVDDPQQPVYQDPQQPKRLMILRRTPDVSRPPSENGQASGNPLTESTPLPPDISPSESASPSAASSVVGDEDELTPEGSLNANLPLEGFLLAALNNKQDRLLLLKLDKELEAFLADPKRLKLEFPRMNSYQRMVVHKVADYFQIRHLPDATKKAVILYKSEESAIPSLRFADLMEQEDDEQPPHKMTIMRRQTSGNQRGVPHLISNPDGTTTLVEDRKNMTFEEREAAYAKARAKIFGGGSGSGNEGEEKEVVEKTDQFSSSPKIPTIDSEENGLGEEIPKPITRTSSGKSKSSIGGGSGGGKLQSGRSISTPAKVRPPRPSLSGNDLTSRTPVQQSQTQTPQFVSNFNMRPPGPVPVMNFYMHSQNYRGQPSYAPPPNFDPNAFNTLQQQQQNTNMAPDGNQLPSQQQYFGPGPSDWNGVPNISGTFAPRPSPSWTNNAPVVGRNYPGDMGAPNGSAPYYYHPQHRPQIQTPLQPQGYPILPQQREDGSAAAFLPSPTPPGSQTGARPSSPYSSAWTMRPNAPSVSFYGGGSGDGLPHGNLKDGQFEQNPRAVTGYGNMRPPNVYDGSNVMFHPVPGIRKQWGGMINGESGFVGSGRGGNGMENKDAQGRTQQQGLKRPPLPPRPIFPPNMLQGVAQAPQGGWVNHSWANSPENMPTTGYFAPSPADYRPQYPIPPLSTPMPLMGQTNVTSAGPIPRRPSNETFLSHPFARMNISDPSIQSVQQLGAPSNPPATVYDVERRPPKSTELFDPNSPSSSSPNNGSLAGGNSKVYSPARRKDELAGGPGVGANPTSSTTLRSPTSTSGSPTTSGPAFLQRVPSTGPSPLRKKEYASSSTLLFDYSSQTSYDGVKPSEAAAPRALEHILELFDAAEDDSLMDISIPSATLKRLGPSGATDNRTVVLAVFKKASLAKECLEGGGCERYKLRVWQPLPGGGGGGPITE